MVATQYVEPTEFFKGDSVGWKRSISNYPASDWLLTYYIRGASELDVAASASGNDHVVAITAAQTDALTAGNYWWQAVVTKDTDRFTVGNGQFTVKATLEDVSTGYDGRSHVKKTLDALEGVIEGKASHDQQSYSINGRSLSRMSVEELLTWRDKYRVFYRKELRDEQIANGISTKRKVQARFNT